MILPTTRALFLAMLLSLVAVAGYRWPGTLDVMLLADVALLAAVWIDAVLAPRAGPGVGGRVTVEREASPAFSVGHAGEVFYRWRNGAARAARLRVREVRPELLGGTQPPRALRLAGRGALRERVPVVPVRRGRETAAGAFVVDSTGPLGLGRRRSTLLLPWAVTVYPPLVPMRLRTSVEIGRAHV